MSKIVMRAGKVAIEKQVKADGASGDQTGFFKIPENMNNFGIVRFIDPSLDSGPVTVGAEVFYGPKTELLRIDGVEVLVMDLDNIYATVSNETSKTA